MPGFGAWTHTAPTFPRRIASIPNTTTEPSPDCEHVSMLSSTTTSILLKSPLCNVRFNGCHVKFLLLAEYRLLTTSKKKRWAKGGCTPHIAACYCTSSIVQEVASNDGLYWEGDGETRMKHSEEWGDLRDLLRSISISIDFVWISGWLSEGWKKWKRQWEWEWEWEWWGDRIIVESGQSRRTSGCCPMSVVVVKKIPHNVKHNTFHTSSQTTIALFMNHLTSQNIQFTFVRVSSNDRLRSVWIFYRLFPSLSPTRQHPTDTPQSQTLAHTCTKFPYP